MSQAPSEMKSDRQFILQQINSAAPSTKLNKEDLINKAKANAPQQVNQRNAADLLSHVSQSRAGGQGADVANQKDFATYDHNNTYVTGPFLKSLKKNNVDDILENKVKKLQQDDLRSMRSEYDYKNDKNFTQVLKDGNNQHANAKKQLNQLRQEFVGNNKKEFSLIESSQRSGVSRITAINSLRGPAAVKGNHNMAKQLKDATLRQQQAAAEKLDVPKLVDDLIQTLHTCVQCQAILTNDERVINARFVQSAVKDNQDISVFPVCTRCNFQSIMNNTMQNKQNTRNPTFSRTHDGFRDLNIANKKLLDNLNNDASDEFKQLGTLNAEGRRADYLGAYISPDKIHPPPQYFGAEEATQNAGFNLGIGDKVQMKPPNQTIELTGQGSNRQVPHPLGNTFTQQARSIAQENFAAALERQQALRVARETDKKSCRASVAAKSQSSHNVFKKEGSNMAYQSEMQDFMNENNDMFYNSAYPRTTNQELHTGDIHRITAHNMNKNHFKRRNSFSTYVNSMFNQGVFSLPWNDMH